MTKAEFMLAMAGAVIVFVLFILCPGLWVVAIVQVLWKGRGPTEREQDVRRIAMNRCRWAVGVSIFYLLLSCVSPFFLIYFFNANIALVAMMYIKGWHSDPNEIIAKHSCGGCGFDLRGLPDDAARCPECGRPRTG